MTKNIYNKDILDKHLLVLGGTGSGKTTSVLLPLINNIFIDKKVYGGLFVDVKNNFTDYLYKIEKDTNNSGSNVYWFNRGMKMLTNFILSFDYIIIDDKNNNELNKFKKKILNLLYEVKNPTV